MKKEVVVKKNLDLHAEWMRYVFEHPDILDRIPKGAILILLPEDDKELYDENRKLLAEKREKGATVFAVTLKTPKAEITNIEIVAA